MKYTVRLIIAAIAVAAALVSCTKDLTPGKVDTDPTAGALRTINVSFDTPTKSYLDGNQPCFFKGDSVLVSDGTALDTCAVDTLQNGQRVIRTRLEGETLSAVYPYTAAKLYNDVQVVGIKIPSVQTGKFADANICMADQDNSHDKSFLRFQNKVAILKFYADKSIGVDTIRVSCTERNIATDSKTITVVAPEVDDSQESTPAQDPRIWYVAMDGIKDATSLTFESVTSTQGPVTKRPQSVGDNSIGIGYIYSVFIPYYIEVNKQKWAYCNIGAFLPEEPGLYFAWGDTTGYKWIPEKNCFEEEHLFSWENAPFNNDSTAFNADYFNTVRAEVCPNDVLALKYDAANANWGGNWRMPTEADLKSLKSNLISKNGGCACGDLFFPFAGIGIGDKLNANQCYYWSSTVTSHENNAYSLGFQGSGAILPAVTWNCGLSIRPIFDETLSEDQPAIVTINAYTDGGTL